MVAESGLRSGSTRGSRQTPMLILSELWPQFLSVSSEASPLSIGDLLTDFTWFSQCPDVGEQSGAALPPGVRGRGGTDAEAWKEDDGGCGLWQENAG